MRSLKRFLNNTDGKGPSPRSKVPPVKDVSTALGMPYFAFLKKYSSNERGSDKNRHQKVKVTSTDKFESCILRIIEETSEQGGNRKKSLFCGPVDGVDEVLSAYANIACRNPVIFAVFFDINPYKIEYFTFRLFLTQISDTKEEYLRNLFFYLQGDTDSGVQYILDKAVRNSVTKELHADYLIQLAKKKIPEQITVLRTFLRKGANILDLVREGMTHYKGLAKKMKQNMLLNFNTHWLSDDKLYNAVKESCRNDMIKVMQADINRSGKQKIIKMINDSKVAPLILYIPKGKKKFLGSRELVEKFAICIDTRPPQSKREKCRVWSIMEPERFFSTPQFQHQGELSNKQLMLLTEEYKKRTCIGQNFDERCSIMLLGDLPYGRLYLDERSRAFAEKIQNYANSYGVKHVALCGDIIDGEHTREKRKLALLQYLSDEPRPSIEQQCKLASGFISGFDGNVYSVTSDGDWDIIEEKQRELINQKEFQYKIEKNTSHIPDNIRKSLRVEAIFEAAKEYYDYVERQIGLSEKIGDSLNLGFDTAGVHITHMSIGQYFRKSLTKSVGVKEQQIINQFLAMHDNEEQKDIEIKVSSHDNVLQAHMETEKTLNIKVPSLESSTQYENIPIQLRNAVQDMMHKAFSVRGKIPFLSSCKVEVTKDKRILLTVINEKILDMLERYKNQGAEEYLIYTLTDVHVGSIAHRYDYLIKYLDYVKRQAEKLKKKPNMKNVGRIALFNGDIIEGINYPTAMMRNGGTRLTFPQTQMSCAIEMLKPFFFTEKDGKLWIDDDIEHMVLTHGNHEYNSGFIHSGVMATEVLLKYFKAHFERQYDAETVKKKLMYSLFVKVGKEKTLFSSIGAFSKLGLNVHMMHSYGGRPNIATATPPQKPWDILIQGHYHKFSLGEVAGKVLLTFPSFTEVSDFEYERGLDSPMCGTLLHLSSKYGLVVEILTREFLDNYKCKHPIFKKMSIKRFYESCVEKALEPADLTEYA
jgi:predicted phosphodiesterase